MRSRPFIALVFCLLFSASIAAQSAIESGNYGSLNIAVDGKGVLTGHFREGTGDDGKGNPRFVCSFFIRGQRVDEGRFEIKTWHPEFPDEVIDGEVTASETDGRKGLTMRLDGEHGGCWNVAPVLKEPEGVEFDLIKALNSTSVRMVASPKAYFHASASTKAKQRAFVVKNDSVSVIAVKGDWAEVVFSGDAGKETRGWMPISSFYKIEP